MAMRRLACWLLACPLAAPGLAATILVTTGVDDLTANGNCTLREAFQAAQTNLAVDLCAAGTLAHDLVLLPQDAELELGEIEISASLGPLTLRGAAGGPPPSIHPAAANPSRLFSLNDGVDITFESLVLEGAVDDNSGGGVRASDVDFTARYVTFRSNVAPVGAGLYYSATGDLHLLLDHCAFIANQASGEGGGGGGEARGGGALVFIGAGATARIVDTEFTGNIAATEPGGFGASGGGLKADIGSASTLFVERTTFTQNRVDPQGLQGAEGSGAYLVVSGAGSRLVVVDSAFTGNDIVQPAGNSFAGALHAAAMDGAELVLDRLRLENNDFGEPGRHIHLYGLGTATISVTNLLLANGPTEGLGLTCGDGDCRVGHATITGHGERSAFLQALLGGELRLENSIFFAPHAMTAVGAVVVDGSNLTGGTDPQFTNPAGGDYRLAAGSPAIDLGDATLASVGPYDLDHASRVAGLNTDAGAYEFGSLFADGFESGDRGAWTATLP
jgi:CSLREA domain-containing protein